MKNSIFKIVLSIALFSLFILGSCTEDDKDVEPNPEPENEILTADAGPDKQVETGKAVVLDGSASKSSLGNPITYKWTIVKQPEGATSAIVNDMQEKASFTPSLYGEYEIRLTISNTSRQSQDNVIINAEQVDTTPDTLLSYITTDLHLQDRFINSDMPDYIVPKDVAVTARLQIDPGVVIAFARDTRMDINEEGSLEAHGEEGNEIVFTGIEQNKGYWKGLMIYSNSGSNELEYVHILYAGSKPVLSNYKAALTLFGISKAEIALKNCSISESNGYGMHAAAGSVVGNFYHNTFSNNEEAGIYLDAANVSQLDSETIFTAGNGRNAVEIMQSEINNNIPYVWNGFADKTPYRIAGDITLHTGLKLSPGVVVELEHNVTLQVNGNGYLNAKGTETDSIKITGVENVPGYWKGIRSYSQSPLNELEYVNISGGGNSPIISDKKANIAISGTNSVMSIKNSKIANSAGFGIVVDYTSQINPNVLTENSFENNAAGDLLDKN